MTIEDKINKILNRESNFSLGYAEYLNWTHDMPLSVMFCISDEKVEESLVGSTYREIDELIKKADVTECLTSKSEYIRRCKKWYLKNGTE